MDYAILTNNRVRMLEISNTIVLKTQNIVVSVLTPIQIKYIIEKATANAIAVEIKLRRGQLTVSDLHFDYKYKPPSIYLFMLKYLIYLAQTDVVRARKMALRVIQDINRNPYIGQDDLLNRYLRQIFKS